MSVTFSFIEPKSACFNSMESLFRLTLPERRLPSFNTTRSKFSATFLSLKTNAFTRDLGRGSWPRAHLIEIFSFHIQVISPGILLPLLCSNVPGLTVTEGPAMNLT